MNKATLFKSKKPVKHSVYRLLVLFDINLAAKEGLSSNLKGADLDAILDFVDRYRNEIQALSNEAEQRPKSAPCALPSTEVA